MEKRKVILVAGITGVNKRGFTKALRETLPGEWTIFSIESGKAQEIWEIEEDEKRISLLKERWANVPSQDNIIIEFHCTYWRPWGFLHDHLEPEIIEAIREKTQEANVYLIVLIDNITSIKWRLQSKFERAQTERERRQTSKLGLRDIILWREHEITSSNLLAKMLEIDQIYIIACGHKANIIADIITNPKKKKVYVAFPVRHIKFLSGERKQHEITLINEFKKWLEEKFIIFDPYKIYEKEIENLLIDADPHRVAEVYHQYFLIGDTRREETCGILKQNILGENFFPQDVESPENFSLSIWEIAQVIRDINAQIRERDRLIVRQSDFVVALKPENSRGAQAEIAWSLRFHKKAYALVMNTSQWDAVYEAARTSASYDACRHRDIFYEIFSDEMKQLSQKEEYIRNGNKIRRYYNSDKCLKILCFDECDDIQDKAEKRQTTFKQIISGKSFPLDYLDPGTIIEKMKEKMEILLEEELG